MRATLEDIISRLRHGDYKNEEHVRLAIICRILAKLGWDIWNPIEVNAEFPAIRSEDTSRVDVALFMPPQWLRPAVFFEVKAVGKLMGSIEAAERQLRDYNRNNQAELSVLTDGRIWRFYLASASGEFSQKCFEKFDILDEKSALDDIELALDAFLSKDALQMGMAVDEARSYLRRTDAQRIMFDVLPLSQRDAVENPSLSLVECFINRCTERGVECSKEDAINFVRSSHNRPSPISPPQSHATQLSNTLPIYSETQKGNSQIERTSTEVLLMQGRRGTKASGKNLPSGKFVVFCNSIAADASLGFIKDERGYYPQYRDLVNSKILIPEETNNGIRVYRLTRDYEFSSSSAAASVFLGNICKWPQRMEERMNNWLIEVFVKLA